ncbi:hypothetical protein F4825DRAFT_456982 [Nemania diffusa]|nr:hypothetical protein F4825DRAFT_456982 [Nemania diffusa]
MLARSGHYKETRTRSGKQRTSVYFTLANFRVIVEKVLDDYATRSSPIPIVQVEPSRKPLSTPPEAAPVSESPRVTPGHEEVFEALETLICIHDGARLSFPIHELVKIDLVFLLDYIWIHRRPDITRAVDPEWVPCERPEGSYSGLIAERQSSAIAIEITEKPIAAVLDRVIIHFGVLDATILQVRKNSLPVVEYNVM